MAGTEAAAARISTAAPAAASTRATGSAKAEPAPEERLELLTRLDEHRWLARWDGQPAAAQWLADRYDGAPLDEDALRARARDLLDLHSPRLLPLLAVAPRTGAWWAVWPRAAGVPLRRLRALCDLSPRQVAAVSLGALHAVADLHARGWWHGRLGAPSPAALPAADDVLVGPDGKVRLAGWAPGTLLLDGSEAALRTDDLAAVRGLAAGLLAGTRTGPGWSAERRDAEVEALERTADGDPGAGVRPPDAPDPAAELLEQRLAALLGGPDQAERTRVELAALVRAVPVAADTDIPVEVAPSTPSSAGERPRTRSRRRRPSGPRRRPTAAEPRPDRGGWLWKAIAALTVLTVVVGLELGLLGDKIARDLRVLRSPATSAGTATTTTGRASTALPSLGAASAGVVGKVEARALGPCAPGKACTLRVVVQVQPAKRPQRVAWEAVAVDRCTARRHLLPGSTLTVPAGATTASALRIVKLPTGNGLAVGAITTSPARAASKALPAPARAPVC